MDEKDIDLTYRVSYQAFEILHVGYTIIPIAAGFDKFYGYLTDWEQYLVADIPLALNVSDSLFINWVGVVEIIIGGLILVRPRIGGILLALFLVGVIANFLYLGAYYDIALRDFGLALGALTLTRLSRIFK